MKGKPLRAVAKQKDGSVAIYLDGVIDSSGRGDSCDTMMREQLARAGGAAITLYVNCDGGKVTEGMAIYNTLRAYPGRKVCIITGLAASMGSVVPMACDEIRMAKGSFLMIHNPLIPMTGGNADELRKTADNLERMQGELLDIYEARTGIDRAQLQKYLDAETYFTAEEALAAGLIDKIEGELEASVSLEAVARLDREKVPAALRALATKGKVMKGKNAKMLALEEELAKLKAMAAESDDDEPTDEEEEEEKPKDEEEEEEEEKPKDAATSALVAVVQEVTGTKNIGQATAKLAGMLSSAGAASAGDRAKQVAALIKSGKLLPSLKRWALACATSDFKTYVASIGGSSVIKMGASHDEPEEVPKIETPIASGRAGSAETIIAKQFKVDVTKIKEAPLPPCVPAREGAR